MIPAKLEQFLKNLNEPDFFSSANGDACAEIHALVREFVENGTETIEVEINVELLLQVEKVLRGLGWTVEEALVLFLLWCIVCPERLSAWCGKTKDGEVNEENTNAVQA